MSSSCESARGGPGARGRERETHLDDRLGRDQVRPRADDEPVRRALGRRRLGDLELVELLFEKGEVGEVGRAVGVDEEDVVPARVEDALRADGTYGQSSPS